LKEGARIALISDAGTPLVSDPGYRLVMEAVDEGIAVSACPGASAVLHALAIAGLPTNRFMFLGFFPEKDGDRARLCAEVKGIRSTLLFFESPHRIVETLQAMAAGLPGRRFAVGRELTKLHEDMLRGTADEIAAVLAARPAIKGEITIVAGPPAEMTHSLEEAEPAMREALAAMPASKAAAEIAKRFGLPRKEVYARMLALKQ
jgi:16S rRNA (cytidine1402-2'-O)-methyltransferase